MKKLLIALAAVFITAAGAEAQVLLRGDVWYYINHQNRFHLEADALTNFNDRPTDRLRFRMWASDHHWTPYERGRLLAFGGLPKLAPGQTRYEIHSTVGMHFPASDWYHMTLTVEERSVQNGKVIWNVVDLIEFDDTYLRNPSDWWKPFPF